MHFGRIAALARINRSKYPRLTTSSLEHTVNNSVLPAIANAPVMLNVLPQSAETICSFMQVLHEEGYPAIEVLARPLDKAAAMIEQINDSPQRKLIHLGIGTIKTPQDARTAVALKPDFVVSPVFSRSVLEITVEADIPYMPAVYTLQDIQNVMDAFSKVGREMTVLKLCPVNMLSFEVVEIMGAIYPGVTFCPTGNITLETLPHWKKIPCIGPAMQSSFVPPEWLEKGDWPKARTRLQEIKKITRKT